MAYALTIGLLAAGCTSEKKDEVKEMQNSHDAALLETLSVKTNEPKEPFTVETWVNTDSTILLSSYGTENLLYRISPDSLEAVSAFGREGQGPGEYFFPAVAKYPGGYAIVNSGHKSIEFYEPGKEKREKNYPDITVNMPLFLNDSIMLYKENVPGKLMLKIYDIDKNEVRDSILYVAEDESMSNSPIEFSYDVENNTLAIGKLMKDEIEIYEITPSYNLVPKVILTGNNDLKSYYSDIKVKDGKVYALFHGGEENSDGFTTTIVEVYDLEGNALKRYATGVKARDGVIHGDKLIMSASRSNELYSVDLPRM